MGHGYIDLGRNTTFASKKELAWHGLGSVVDCMTSKEAMVLGGLDFEVGLKKLYTIDDLVPMETKQEVLITRELLTELPSNYATYRKDNQHLFGIVGARYEVIQNTDAFEFFDSIIGEGHAEYETVGALGDGERVFITAKLPSAMHVNKDTIDKYLLLSMAHDGSGAIVVMFTPIRVVCNNTLSMALRRASKTRVSIRHTKNALERLDKAKQILGIADHNFNSIEEYLNIMSKRSVRDEDVRVLFKNIFSMPLQENGRLSTRSENKLNDIVRYYHEGVGQKEIVGNQYGVFNAVTGYLQNGLNRDNETQFTRTFISGDDNIRQSAVQALNIYHAEGIEPFGSLQN